MATPRLLGVFLHPLHGRGPEGKSGLGPRRGRSYNRAMTLTPRARAPTNLKHNAASLVRGDIHVLSGKHFASTTADVDPERAARTICVMAARRARSRFSPQQFLPLLVERYRMFDVAEMVEPVLDQVAAHHGYWIAAVTRPWRFAWSTARPY